MKKRSLFLTLLLLAVPLFAGADWRSDADARIEKIRKGDFKVELLDAKGAPVKNAHVTYQLKRHEFLFGMAIAYGPFADQGEDGQHYRQFILDNFNALVCENEMKWYENEAQRGKVDYSHADALYDFGEKNGLKMRGHNLFWEKKEFVQPWLAALNPAELRAAVDQRLATTVTRYKDKVICWDVNNEMLDGSFYRDHLGIDGIVGMFTEAARLAPKTALFVNEYAILGNPEKTERFIALIKELQAKGAPVGGIGIQSHDSDRLTADPHAAPIGGDRPEWMMNQPLTPEMFIATLDRLYSATKLPVHLTEISAKTPDPVRRADDLEMLFRLGFSHPSVQAIMLWGFTAKTHWMGPDASLVDADNKINIAGQRISHLLREEWTSHGEASAGKKGKVAWRGFYGTYTVTVKLPDGHSSVSEVTLTPEKTTAVVRITN
jgi:GH35 family endo-1,4-beta-xylanase